MKQVTREQWTTALRSGDYKQGRLRLYTPGVDEYCCLGVLADIAGAEKTDLAGGSMIIDGVECFSLIPDSLYNMVGISGENVCKLMEMNDYRRYTFSDIADYIDKLPVPEKAS